ncbi:MAG: FAD/NAD(P)-binding protein [Phycisphaerales bacterium]|nr:FAD/NAD(P)-binding protein [Phycisphaerales bacterium]
MSLDWLIIGGGIHGVHIAARLLADAEISPDKLRIVDPGNRLLACWRRCAAATGMTHLRSSSAHHLGIDHTALRKFAGKQKSRKPGHFAVPYTRPSLSLFNDHCDHVEKSFGLSELHIQQRAVQCVAHADKVEVLLDDGRSVDTRHLVLAIGASEQPTWPAWAPRNHAEVHHIFDPDFDDWPSKGETVMVVGGGISAAHMALRLIKEGHQVHLVSRHAMRQHRFDSDPAWLGWKYTATFTQTQVPEERRAIITEARHTGSVPPEVASALRRAIGRKQLVWHEGEISQCVDRTDGLEVHINQDSTVHVNRILLATGFDSQRPGGQMIDELIASASLACACCGYPIIDSHLRWHPRIYVSGPLAELELGPISRNIAGAQRAGERIVEAARSKSVAINCV